MVLLDRDILHTSPVLCHVDPDYVDYLRKHDWRVSTKRRPFVGLAVRINNRFYVIPLTSQTTQKRKERGKKRRNPAITTFIKDGSGEIANLLHNNMFPVPEDLIERIDIDPMADSYLANEERYIRKHWIDINNKSIAVYQNRYRVDSTQYHFLDSTCCDFRKLEMAHDVWLELNQ